MAIFHRQTPEEIKSRFQHKGFIFGVVPVYIGNINGFAPDICVRNWVPEFFLDVVEVFHGASGMLISMLHPDFEPQFKIVVTGKI